LQGATPEALDPARPFPEQPHAGSFSLTAREGDHGGIALLTVTYASTGGEVEDSQRATASMQKIRRSLRHLKEREKLGGASPLGQPSGRGQLRRRHRMSNVAWLCSSSIDYQESDRRVQGRKTLAARESVGRARRRSPPVARTARRRTLAERASNEEALRRGNSISNRVLKRVKRRWLLSPQ